MRAPATTAIALLLLACGAPAPPDRRARRTAPTPRATPLTAEDYLALSGPAPTLDVRYGPAPSQHAELFEPAGPGPFPVVVLVHGGCWSSRLEGLPQLRGMAGALAGDGIAAWNVEYRRLDEDGGGYPGTYQDVAAALAALAALAAAYHLDLHRVVAVGHSAGGQLVQWLAGRAHLPTTSPLHDPHPFVLRAVVSLGGLADLRAQGDRIRAVCHVDPDALTGRASADRPDPYADTNAAALVPTGLPTTLINGALDEISPPEVAEAYAEVARRAGDTFDVIVLPDASHFDEVAITSPAWATILPILERATR